MTNKVDHIVCYYLVQVQCATKVGQSTAWLASGDNTSAHISIVECVTPAPLVLECFKVDLVVCVVVITTVVVCLLLLVFVHCILFHLPSSHLPLYLLCFSLPFSCLSQVNSKRILDILYVPPSSICPDLNSTRDTLQRQVKQSKGKMGTIGSLVQLPSYLATVWMGAQCGK